MTRVRLTREERKQETRRHLLEAGAAVFARMGFHGASIDKIVEEAGYTKGAFYAHFDSKEALFLLLFEEQLDLEVKSIDSVLGKQFTLNQFISFMTRNFESDWKERRTWDLLKMEFVLYAMREESIRQSLAEMVMRSVRKLEEDLKPLLEEGSQRGLTAEGIVWTMVSLESGMAIFHYIIQDDMPKQLFENALRDVFRIAKPNPDGH